MNNENYDNRSSSIKIKIFLFIALVGVIYFLVTPTKTQVRMSHYWPPLGNVNCYHDPNTGECVDTVANGDKWSDWVGKNGAACPTEWEFGRKFKLPDGRIITCVDRGEAVKYVDGIPYVDLLEESPSYDYGEIVTVEFIR